jgi:hypothetical protein
VVVGNNVIIYLDDLEALTLPYNLKTVSKFIIYVDNLDKLKNSELTFINCTFIISDIVKDIHIDFNIKGSISIICISLSELPEFKTIDKNSYFQRNRLLKQLHNKMELSQLTQIYTPDNIYIYIKDISFRNLAYHDSYNQNVVNLSLSKPTIHTKEDLNTVIIDSLEYNIVYNS